MFVLILILILFLPVAGLSLVLRSFFTLDELNDMGICLEDPQSMQIPAENQTNRPQSGSLCLRVKLSH